MSRWLSASIIDVCAQVMTAAIKPTQKQLRSMFLHQSSCSSFVFMFASQDFSPPSYTYRILINTHRFQSCSVQKTKTRMNLKEGKSESSRDQEQRGEREMPQRRCPAGRFWIVNSRGGEIHSMIHIYSHACNHQSTFLAAAHLTAPMLQTHRSSYYRCGDSIYSHETR